MYGIPHLRIKHLHLIFCWLISRPVGKTWGIGISALGKIKPVVSNRGGQQMIIRLPTYPDRAQIIKYVGKLSGMIGPQGSGTPFAREIWPVLWSGGRSSLTTSGQIFTT
jgi:hypothetical protein